MPLRPIGVDLATRIATPLVAQYIRGHRDQLSSIAKPLSHRLTERLSPHFREADLNSVRVVIADPLPISIPPLVGLVRRVGMSFPDPRLVSGITFGHVVALRDEPRVDLLFHELVHVVQYRLLGIRQFAQLYTRGFLTTGSYDEIPLERCAYDLEARSRCGEHFDVEAEVRSWF